MSHPVRWLALVCAPVLLIYVVDAQAAEKRARFTVKVDVEGTEGVIGNGADRTSARFREGYTLVTYLKSDGELQQFDSKDPQYAQKMLGLSQNVHSKVRAAQGKGPVKKMTRAQIQEYVQKKQVACGANQDCLMKLALEAQELMSNMDVGGATSQGSTDAYTGDEPPRYLNYFGYDNCGATAHVYVDRTTQGTLGDTSGAVPYTVIDKADYHANPVEIRLFCNAHTLVVDSRDGSFSGDGAILPTANGTSTTTMRGKTQQATGEAATHGEVYTWVSEQLRQAERSGQKSTTLELTQGRGGAIHSGRYSGEARVTLSWKLEDVK